MYTDIPMDQSANQTPYVWTLPDTAAKTAPIFPTEAAIHDWVQKSIDILGDGFQWKDLPPTIKSSVGFLSNFPLLSTADKRNLTLKILDEIINLTDTPYLPDSFSDPLFKAMAPAIVNFMIPDQAAPSFSLFDITSSDYLPQVANDLLAHFKDGFQWNDLGYVAEFAVNFGMQYSNLTMEGRAGIAKRLTDYMIDQTSFPYLIDAISDPIFKAIIHPMIDAYFEMRTAKAGS